MGQALQRAVAPGVLPAISGQCHQSEEGEEQLLRVNSLEIIEDDQESETGEHVDEELEEDQKFPDLGHLPPELAIQVLKNLNATDLCLASCVWQQLASDNILWQGLCRTQWQYASIYNNSTSANKLRFRNVYLMLDEGTLTFNSEPDVKKGMRYFISKGLVRDNPYEIARFLDGTSSLHKTKVRQFLQARQDVVEYLVSFQNYFDAFLPNALRRFFSKLEAPNDRGSYLQRLVEKFSVRFCQCNPSLGMTVDSVYVLCFSLLLLSVDLASPHVKNKMSKREFIKNTRGAVTSGGDEDLYGSFYDNVFLRGHVADQDKKTEGSCQQQYVPGYLAIFL